MTTTNNPCHLSDKEIDALAKPYSGMGGVENYRAFARDVCGRILSMAVPSPAPVSQAEPVTATDDLSDIIAELTGGSNWLRGKGNVYSYSRSPRDAAEILKAISGRDIAALVENLKSADNWKREGFGHWKDVTSSDNRAPFEAATALESLFSRPVAAPPAPASEAVKELVEALERIVRAVPAQDGNGGFVVDHHSPDGEYLGTQQIDPMWVIDEMASVAQAALAKHGTQAATPLGGKQNAELAADSNNAEPEQQRELAGSMEMGQPLGGGKDKAAGDIEAEGNIALIDDFRGDNAHLCRCIKALIELDATGTLVPHGIGGHARVMLSAAAVRLMAKDSPSDLTAYGENVREAAATVCEAEADRWRGAQDIRDFRLCAAAIRSMQLPAQSEKGGA